jgi:hypothetical protein
MTAGKSKSVHEEFAASPARRLSQLSFSVLFSGCFAIGSDEASQVFLLSGVGSPNLIIGLKYNPFEPYNRS